MLVAVLRLREEAAESRRGRSEEIRRSACEAADVADEAEDYGPERATNAPSFFYSRRVTLSVAAGVLAVVR